MKEWFPEDHTHTSPEGADFNASMVVAALKGIDSPLVAWLSEKGKAVKRYSALPDGIIVRKYDALGPEKAEPFLGDEHTHTSR